MMEKCDPDKFICTVNQYFVERNIIEQVIEKKGVAEAMDTAKPLFSEELETDIAKAEYLRDKRLHSFSFEDIDRLRDEIKHWENVQRDMPGLYSNVFVKQQIANKRRIYQDLLFAENEAFKSAINKKDMQRVYVAVLRRLPEKMIYDLTDKSDVVDRVITGETIADITKAHPEMPEANIHRIAEIIERGKY